MSLAVYCDAFQLQKLAGVVSEMSRDYVRTGGVTPEQAYRLIAEDIDFPASQRDAFVQWASSQNLFEQERRSERQRKAERAIERVLSRKGRPVEKKKLKAFTERVWEAAADTEAADLPGQAKQAYLAAVTGVEITDADRAMVTAYSRRIEGFDPGSAERARLTAEMLDNLAAKFPASRFSLLISMNYSGMISSPFTFINNAVAGVKTRLNAKLASLSQGASVLRYLDEAFSLRNPAMREAMSVQGRYALAFDTNRKSVAALESSRKPDFGRRATQNALKNATAKDIFGEKLAGVLPKKWQEAGIGQVWQSVFDIQNATDVLISTQTDYYYLGRLLYEDIARRNPGWNDARIFEEMDRHLHIKNDETVARAKETVLADSRYPFHENPSTRQQKEENLVFARRVQELLLGGFTHTGATGAQTKYEGADAALLDDAAYLTDLGLLKRSTEIRDQQTGQVRMDTAGRVIRFVNGLDEAIERLQNDEDSGFSQLTGYALRIVKTQVLPFARVTVNFMDRRSDYVPLYANVKAARYASKRGKPALTGFLLGSRFDLAREQVEFQDRKMKAVKGMATAMLIGAALAVFAPGEDEEEREGQGFWLMATGNGTGMPKGTIQGELFNKYGRNRLVFGYGNDTSKYVSVPYGNDQTGLAINILSTVNNIFRYRGDRYRKSAEVMKDEEKAGMQKSMEMSAYVLGSLGQETFQGSFNLNALRIFDGIKRVSAGEQAAGEFATENAINQASFAANLVPYANGWRALEGALFDSEKVNRYYRDMAWSMVPFTRAANKARPALDFFARPMTQVPAESTNIVASAISDYRKRVRSAPAAEVEIRDWMADNLAVPKANPTAAQLQYTILPGAKDLEGKVNDSGQVRLRVMPEAAKYELAARTGLLSRMLFTDPAVVAELKAVTARTDRRGKRVSEAEEVAATVRRIYSTALQVAKYDMLQKKGVGVDLDAAKFDRRIGGLIISRYLPQLEKGLAAWRKEHNVEF